MMPDFHVPFRTAYRRPFIPKGGRVQRDEYPYVHGIAVVPQIARGDASVAFRIVYPANGLTMVIRPERDVQILSFGGKLWWPYGEAVFADPETKVLRFMSADEWRDKIGSGRDLLGILPKVASTVETETFSRIDLADERGQATARVQRVIYENFIVCDGAIYAAGGVPVHVRWLCNPFSEVVVASAGHDRRVANFDPLCADPGHFARRETQLGFSEGDFWQPGRLVAADLPRLQRRYPEIQVIDDRMIPSDLVDRVQTDALFRRIRSSLEWFLRHSSAPGAEDQKHAERADGKWRFEQLVRKTFGDAVAPGPDYSTTFGRLEALRTLFEGRRRVPKRYLPTVEAMEKSFRRLNRRNPRGFDPVDLAALESMN